jgi:hypothetical protein
MLRLLVLSRFRTGKVSQLFLTALYCAAEEVGIGSNTDDASLSIEEAAELASDIADSAAEEASETAEETSDITEETTGASDELTGAADELTGAWLDGVVSTTVVVAGRLKIQIRPMITITATMMIIQVLRFMGVPLLGGERPGGCLCLDAWPHPVFAASYSHPSVAAFCCAGILGFVFVEDAAA